jgi:hypothetical protein
MGGDRVGLRQRDNRYRGRKLREGHMSKEPQELLDSWELGGSGAPGPGDIGLSS